MYWSTSIEPSKHALGKCSFLMCCWIRFPSILMRTHSISSSMMFKSFHVTCMFGFHIGKKLDLQNDLATNSFTASFKYFNNNSQLLFEYLVDIISGGILSWNYPVWVFVTELPTLHSFGLFRFSVYEESDLIRYKCLGSSSSFRHPQWLAWNWSFVMPHILSTLLSASVFLHWSLCIHFVHSFKNHVCTIGVLCKFISLVRYFWGPCLHHWYFMYIFNLFYFTPITHFFWF